MDIGFSKTAISQSTMLKYVNDKLNKMQIFGRVRREAPSTSSPDYVQPPTSCVVHGKLGLKDAFAFDVSVCSGFVYGLGWQGSLPYYALIEIFWQNALKKY